ncbi:MAG: hypothetical protein BWY65_01646 [Firmicutes bacterium ADurb.Bin373]|nr:MAG: hypothetical protein BWY65_01646 [Firmicutes bacterium ADurb.Bin373]
MRKPAWQPVFFVFCGRAPVSGIVWLKSRGDVMVVEVIEVLTPRGMQLFNNFPRHIYGELHRSPFFPVLEKASPRFDRLFSRVEAQPFLAIRRGYVVGRIAACVNHTVPDNHSGYFGYFESINHAAVAGALIKAAGAWLAARGRSRMTGPVDLTPHERLGLLAGGYRGYHHPGMPYNPPYYSNLFEQIGLEKEITLYAYHYDLRQPAPEKLVRVAARAVRNKQMKLRSVNFNDLSGEGEIFSRIHNSSMHEIWGFAALSPVEGAAIWRKLKSYYDPALILVAEVDGEPAGLCLTLCPLGRRYFSGAGCFNARLAVLSVLPQYRRKGLEAALILESARRARDRGVTALELSLVADNNVMMNRIIQSLPGVIRSREYKVYRQDIDTPHRSWVTE